jgi:hypothetical protein
MKSTLLRLSCFAILGLASACALDENEREQPLDHDQVVCIEIAPDCPAGEAPADTDGDGCALECAPVVCPAVWVECPDGEVPTDTDGDGCALECAPAVACPAIWVECPEGEVPMDIDGDGCALECGVFCGNNP